MLVVAQSLGITDTFKSNVLYSGALGACIGTTYMMYHDAALSEWSIARHISPAAMQNAMLALEYSETQAGIYYPKKRMFTPFHRCDSERITLTTRDGCTRFSGPYLKLKGLSARLMKQEGFESSGLGYSYLTSDGRWPLRPWLGPSTLQCR